MVPTSQLPPQPSDRWRPRPLTGNGRSDPIIEVRGLRVDYATRHGHIRAVNGIDLALYGGECLGLVGESGSGKSTTGWALLRMVPWPGRITGGQILYRGEDLLWKRESEMRRIRGSEISIVIQGVRAGLNPLVPVGYQVKNVYRAHAAVSDRVAWRRVLEMLELVALPDPERVARSYPHELSGGMAQRVIIASALVCSPNVLIADEPTTGLDVTVQVQILDLLKDISERLSMSTMIVTHDLSVVAQYCQKVAVLYAGQLMEQAPVERFIRRPLHPYSIALLDASSYERIGRRSRVVSGSPMPAPGALESCPYHLRCPIALPICRSSMPPLDEVAPGSFVRCFRGAEVMTDSSLRAVLGGSPVAVRALSS